MKQDNIELRSEKVRGIIGEIPHFIIRVGISVVLLVIVLLFFICYIIKVPAIVECDIREYKAGKLVIATDKVSDISKGNTYELTYNGDVVHADTIRAVEKYATIDSSKVLYNITTTLPDTIKIRDRDIIVGNYSSLKATIKMGEKRLLYKYLNSLEIK